MRKCQLPANWFPKAKKKQQQQKQTNNIDLNQLDMLLPVTA